MRCLHCHPAHNRPSWPAPGFPGSAAPCSFFSSGFPPCWQLPCLTVVVNSFFLYPYNTTKVLYDQFYVFYNSINLIYIKTTQRQRPRSFSLPGRCLCINLVSITWLNAPPVSSPPVFLSLILISQFCENNENFLVYLNHSLISFIRDT